ncbi:protein-disulfide reductase DsbD family protein [Phenylobacterium deserti]|uniref:Thiol:disulfide interchange protein n=1 Tax=Phenylobacterium deserti TaxID=1914756 RepID=A0A328AY19_9CAUL|nr:protein-disulfide reductase DsbD domain-containing protein [Phenylobacterium deserti]RAK57728.1 thiol:disulfide interchange protein [Phenylobacterium deserti]
MRFLTGLLMALAMAGGAAAQPVDTGHLEAELVASTRGVAPGQSVQVALRQKIDDGWHTYWRNSGDSGEATQVLWSLPQGWSAGPIVWPAPKRLPVGPLMNYGFEGEILLPMTLTAPADARPGESVALKAKANFLVCAELCVPEEADLTLNLPVVAGAPPADPKWGPAIGRTLADAPKPLPAVKAAFQHNGERFTLAVAGPPLASVNGADAYFFPYVGGVVDHAAPQLVERGPEGLTLSLKPGSDLAAGAPLTALDGVLAVDGKVFEVAAAAGPAPAQAAGLGPPPAKSSGGGFSLMPAAALAFVGGLILNLMPCVFPILAMKAASLAGHAHEAAGARRQGLAFGAGVLVTFLALASVLIALKAAGSAVGWGFQLQSPPVVAVLALLMLAVALNLSGVFEVGASLQNVGAPLADRRGLAGAFFTGVLAVVVAAPCTAPLMGPAIGWALTQTPVAALVVFLALGVGFAAPFVLAAFAPALLNRLPKPGPWMSVFKKALAFPMYGAAAWLVWVLTLQAGAPALARILAAAIVVALAAWLAGAAQRQMMLGRRPAALGGASAVLALLAVGAAVYPAYADAPAAAAPAKLAEEAYSPQRLAELRAQGKPVFVNYTAAWCVSCQVNDRLALSTPKVADAFEAKGVAYLKADWTRRDPVIAADLARFGRAGVPLYLVYGADGGEPKILPAILTEGLVLRALDAASAG